MGAWLSNISLKYKFWAVNAVAFITTLLLVLYAVQLEQQARSDASQASAQAQGRLLSAWPVDKALPKSEHWLTFARGQTPQLADMDLSALSSANGWIELNHMPLFGENPLRGAEVVTRPGGQQVAVLAYAPSLSQVFTERFANYAVAVLILMLAMLGASQLLIRFLLSQLNTLKDVMLHVEKTGDLSARVPLACKDEVGQMATAFNAMQAGYQRVVSTVARTAQQLDEGAARLASSMNEVQHGMLGQQSETDQAATAINEMTATVHHIAQHAGATRDLSQSADTLAGSGQAVVTRVRHSIAGLSSGVQQTAEMIQKLAEDSQKISSVVSVIHSIAEQTNLLALNAAIEAARAGEMGRGFAVVADEVRNLAKRVQSSTDEITRMISALQAGTRDAVDFMQESSFKADDCVQQAQEASSALAEITGAVAQMRENNTQIAVAAEQQSHVAEEMNRAVVSIRDVTENTVQQTVDSATTSNELATLAGELSKAIGQLKL
ncbi:methyl-accepting chemotaxis protein [Pseudomonas extremaustralis]|jgi:methyl-accepting chemotaxis protein|uniref:Methyl-accepting chemotaxis protein n=1 Tax=Pseudomonas extremaustralis TaxID=359110 RepID=A0A5C5QEC3_9PSED|nr:methyl-accepting chemotaxis protein [Pseudomonas extremaustralis]EZI28019.1 chemotaxis protein [Pseudomonas extremaustralis 14-3 substr. 14-3b]MDF3133668.1 methyl-accepting chemotaxis protein [Pseudomonas extremaustralis]TWS03682.1 methyl-accepting chemotaxis protein [Pseudomonas extremaustralis]UUJ41913.1 methyl-accepting chemotaxis protein [Pseudomonas extremaustralis]SDF39734.1 Methyl-accepting chemotaxis protein [Pseudomonas extremaustralis]